MEEVRKTKFGLEKRGVAACVILSFVTFGIYYIYWIYILTKSYNNVNNSPEKIGTEMALNVFIPFYFLFWIYTRTQIFTKNMRQKGYLIEDDSTTYLLLSMFGFGIVALGMIQNSFNVIVDGTITSNQNGNFNQNGNCNSSNQNTQQSLSSKMTKDDFIAFVEIQKKHEMSQTNQIVLSEEATLDFKNNIERGKIYLEDKEWNKAYLYFEKALSLDPKSSECYFGEFLSNLQISSESELLSMRAPFYSNKNYINAIKYADSNRKTELINLSYEIMYARANELFEKKQYGLAKELYGTITGYKDSTEYIEKCAEKTLETYYLKAKELGAKKKWLEANEILSANLQYKDSEQLIKENELKIKDGIYDKGLALKEGRQFDEAISLFNSLTNYKDCAEQIEELERLKIIQKRKNKKTLKIALSVFSIIIIFVISITSIPPLVKYNKANELLTNEQFGDAKELFVELGDYSNSSEMAFECDYRNGIKCIKDKKYFQARNLLVQISTYKDSEKMIQEANYLEGYDCYQNKDYVNAIFYFNKCKSHKNTTVLLDKVYVGYGDEFYAKEDYVNAFKNYDYVSHSSGMINNLEDRRINTAEEMCSKGDYLAAYSLINKKILLTEYDEISRKVLVGLLNQGVIKYDIGKYPEAEEMFQYVTANKESISQAQYNKAKAYKVFVNAQKGKANYYDLYELISYPEAKKIIQNDFELMKKYLAGSYSYNTWKETDGGKNEFTFYEDGRFKTTLRQIDHTASSFTYRDGGIYFNRELCFQITIANNDTISVLCAADGKYYTFVKN